MLYVLDRQNALETTEAVDIAERAAGISRLVRDLPREVSEGVVTSADSRAFRVWSTTVPSVERREPSEEEIELVAFLRTQLPRIAMTNLRVQLIHEGDQVPHTPEYLGPLPALTDRESARWTGSLAISIQHDENDWLNFLGFFNTPSSAFPELLIANIASALIAIAFIAFWLVGRVVAPLSELAKAAERLGDDIDANPLRVSGPREVRIAASAFNRMQARLERLIRGRTELLAEISHDLRTPLTHARLRLELMPTSRNREKLLATVTEMEEIIDAFLTYAHALHGSEERRIGDVGAIIASICDDLGDAGTNIEHEIAGDLVMPCRPLALKRAFSNLIENGIKYGGAVRVTARQQPNSIVIRVLDDGPGIPTSQLQAVFKPFYRLQPDADADKRGVGLGLSIAQLIVEDHRGTITLSNKGNSGLMAEIIFPRADT